MIRYTSFAVFVFSALALVIASGFSLGAAMLVLGSATLLRHGRKVRLERDDRRLIAILLVYFAVNGALLAYHHAPLREYDAPLRFLLAIPALLLLLAYPPRPAALWAGLAAGAIGAGLYAGWQHFLTDATRASGTTNPIQYGNISLLLGVLCLAGIGWAQLQSNKMRWTALLIAGSLFGSLGSFFTGSRGSWIGLPFCLGVLAVNQGGSHGKRYLQAGMLSSIALIALLYMLPNSSIKERIELAVTETQDFIKTGNPNSSTGARLEMWRTGLAMVPERPWLGWGKQGYMEHKMALIKQGTIAPIIGDHTHLHNEYVDALVKRGVAGLLALLVLYLGALLLFARQLKDADRAVHPYALGGVLLYLSYLLFGLTQAFMTHNNGVMMLGFLTVILWASLRAQQRAAAA